MKQRREHGAAGGAMRLTVVAHADVGRAAGRTGDEGPAIVGGVGKLVTDTLDEGVRVGSVRAGRDEAALLDGFFDAV